MGHLLRLVFAPGFFGSGPVQTALLTGGVVAIVSGLVGTFAVLAGSLTPPVVGALLIFSLMIGPPAAARAVTSRPQLAMCLSVVIALITVWAAIALSLQTNWPVGFFVGSLGACCYAAGRGWAAWRRSRAAGAGPASALAPQPVSQG
jgi:zinc/manganese transport system permease protein